MTSRRGFLAALLALPVVAKVFGREAESATYDIPPGVGPTFKLPSRVTCVEVYRDQLWIGTEADGLWSYRDGWKQPQRVPGTSGGIHGLKIASDELYVFSGQMTHVLGPESRDTWRLSYGNRA